MNGSSARSGMVLAQIKMTAGVSFGATLLAVACSIVLPACSQVQSTGKLQKTDGGWQLSVISGALPEKTAKGILGRIEDERFVCRNSDSVVLEVPLKSITEITRDTAKDYPASRWLMAVATQPSDTHPVIGSRQYREELKARAVLGLLAMVAGLFPRHKEVLRIRWAGEEGQQDAIFLMGRSQGRAMLAALKKETGLDPHDLEQERKKEAKRAKFLSQQNTGHSDPRGERRE
jgi:hypothetical protein